MVVRPLRFLYCVDRGHCDELITHSECSYWMCSCVCVCVCVCARLIVYDLNLKNREPRSEFRYCYAHTDTHAHAHAHKTTEIFWVFFTKNSRDSSIVQRHEDDATCYECERRACARLRGISRVVSSTRPDSIRIVHTVNTRY